MKKNDRSFKWIGGMVNVLQIIKKSKKGKKSIEASNY